MAVFARIGRLFRGFLGLFISGIEQANPEALMEAARQDFRDKMAQYNMALARMAGIAERLKSQVKAKTVRAKELERRILANHQAGNLDLGAAAWIAAGLFIGTVFGAIITIRLPNRTVKLLYGVFLIFVAARFFFF